MKNLSDQHKASAPGNEALAEILARVSDGILVLDGGMQISYANAQAGKLLGREAASLLGKNYWDEFPEARQTRAAEICRQALETREPAQFEEFEPRSGCWFEYRLRPSPDSLTIYFTDSSAARAATQSLRESEEKFTQAFITSPDGIIIARRSDGCLLDFNESFIRLVGYSREELNGHSTMQLNIWVEPQDRERMLKILDAEGVVYNQELQFRRKSGEIRSITLFSRGIQVQGEACLLSFYHDITTQKRNEIIRRQAEKDLQQANEQLEARVRERTAELEQSKARLEEALLTTDALYAISRALIEIEKLDDAIQKVSDLLASELGYDRVCILTFDLQHQRVTGSYAGGPNRARIQKVSFGELWEGLSGWVLRERRPALSPRGQPDERESARVQQRRAESDAGAVVVVPINFHEELLGTITAINSPAQPDFSQKDVDLLVSLANQVAAAIENNRLYHSLIGEVQDRQQAQLELQKTHDELELRVEERTHELLLTNRTLKMISACNQALIHSDNQNELISAICRIVVQTGGYRLCWLGFAEQNAEKSVHPVAAEGYEEGYLQNIQVSWADNEYGRGPTGTAIRTGQPVIAQNIHTNPSYAMWRKQATLRGYASACALPLMVDGQAIGALNIYAGQPDAFGPQELTTLLELSSDLAYGIAALHARAERLQSLEALRLSEAHYRLISENTADMIWTLYLDNQHFEYISPSVQKMLGYSVEEALELNLLQILAPESLERMSAAWLARIQDYFAEPVQISYTDEVEQIRKDGSLCPSEITTNFVAGPSGRLLVVGVTRDISERKRANALLQKSQSSLEMAQAQMHLGSWELDPQTGQGFWSREMFQLFGFDPQAGVPLLDEFMQKIHPQDREKLLAGQASVMQTGESCTVIYRSNPDLGPTRYFEASQHAVRAADGQFLYMAGTALDVTEKQQAQEDLRQSEETTRAILNASTESAFLVEPDGTVLAANQPGAARLGVESSALIGKELFDFIPPATAAQRRAVMQQVVQSGKPAFFEDQRWGRWIANSIYPVFNAAGQVTRAAIYGRDITENKLAEAELLRYRDHLEALVQERTAQLEVAREQADAANHAKSDFLAVMSHEIRTPMNGVLGLAHLALQTELNPKQRNYLTHIQSSGETLLTLINDILDFSKIEAGKLDMETIDFDLDDVLHSLATLVAFRAQEKGLELVFNAARNVPRQLTGDPNRLRQVLLNLVGNAIKFTERGEVVVRVSLLKRSRRQAELRFSVRDSGIGISREMLDQLFQAFTQADSSTSRRYGGSGLGLVISKRLVNMMGGEINVESQPGLGSVFSFTVRLGRQAGEKSAGPDLAPDLRGLRVLVVDDSLEALKSMKSILTSLTFKVRTASSAEAGLKLVSRSHFDLLIIDQNLDGPQILQRARQIPGLELLPAILLAPPEERELEARDLGKAEGVLVKPVTSSLMFDTIMQLFGYQEQPSAWRKKIRAESESMESVRGRHLLLVEDNEVNQMVARELLESMGFSLAVAGDGQQAIQLAMKEKFDAVLMDIQLPGINGYEATARIRALPGLEQLPIIAMTAHALTGDREKVLAAGLNDYVTKPVDVAQLGSVLRRWLKPAGKTGANINEPAALERPQPPAPTLDQLLDKAPALERLGGNQALFERLLGEVRKTQAGAARQIEAAIQSADIPQAHRLAHSLKGVAATIGAARLREAALQMETALASQAGLRYDGCLTELKSALSELMAALA